MDTQPIGRFIVVAGLMLALNAHAFTGKVVSVADGDTITVLRDRTQVKVRLLEIDAPEKAQAFGTKSKESLSEMCFGKTAELTDKGKDRYGRTLARVTCDGVDANAEQVRLGMAWVYDRYVTDKSLYAVQEEAKVGRRGLWHDDKPVPPWEWRKTKR
ncbi:MAG: Thermonuclease [Nitrosomonadaceae bacterium]|nr:Thermonuclease [Nitrosomonadaceae bacterium]